MLSVDSFLILFVLVSGFYMAWNIGANDVSNAMGTSVGSGALTLIKAVVIAGILEFLGAFLLGGSVSKTIQQDIVDPLPFIDNPRILLFGMIATLLATASWLQVASYFKWPVSTTHAIIGSLIGFGWVTGGVGGVKWGIVSQIALSWILSPVLSALASFFIFTFLQRTVLFSSHPIYATKKVLPWITAAVIMTFIFSLFLNGLGSFHVELPERWIFGIALASGALSAWIAAKLVSRVKGPGKLFSGSPPNVAREAISLDKALRHLQRVELFAKGEKKEELEQIVKQIALYAKETKAKSLQYTSSSDYQVVEKMFASLQILSASYVAFAHGANDVANAIGPVAGAIHILRQGTFSFTHQISPLLLAMGGIGIVVGLATWGWRVMETIGKRITALTPTRGFSAEFGAATTILVASKLGLPISTTHCIVGSVLGVGLARGFSALNLRTLKDIFLSWIITLPASGIVSALIFSLFRSLFRI